MPLWGDTLYSFEFAQSYFSRQVPEFAHSCYTVAYVVYVYVAYV